MAQRFTDKELSRYERQFCMDEIGTKGQERLKNARVLVVGAGGLGSPAAFYLAGAGVGTIGIVDEDIVGLSNLNRQILHGGTRIGRNKAKSAKETLQELNDQIVVEAFPTRLTEKNISILLKNYDFVLDCVDNYKTRFLINDACVKEKKPFCHGGVLRFEGQVFTYVPGEGPCFRCIFEEEPDAESIATADQVGILGATAGVIGSIQALEAIKYILGKGNLLTGRMFIFDGLGMESRIVKFPKASASCICRE